MRSNPTSVSPIAWQQLDPNVQWLWRIQSTIALITFASILTIVFAVLWLKSSVAAASLWLAGTLVFLFFLGWFSYGVYPKHAYQRWAFRIRDEVLEIRKGVAWHQIVAIPISRIQHVDLASGPIERRLDLVKLQLHTAGTGQSQHDIPGLSTFRARKLHSELLLLVRDQVHSTSFGPAATG
ncbi:MAG: PH domain-containing protein [Planctomycetota bacterium]